MSLQAKLAIAALGSIVLTVALFLLFLTPPAPLPPPGEGEPALRSPPAPGAKVSRPARPSSAESAGAKVESQARTEESVRAVQDTIAGGWVISGRIVREAATGTVPDQPAARTEGDVSIVPAPGVAVHLKPHPRRSRPEEAPPPRKLVTGLDGRFEFAGVPGRVLLRLEIDEPSSAYRTLSFQLAEPGLDGRRELGDLLIEPGATLVVKLVGPRDEVVEKGKVLVNKSSSNPGRSAVLSTLGFNESRREAEERGKGEYVLERAALGSLYVEATAPGYAPSGRESVELPRDEPLLVRMLPGSRIAGTVLSAEGKPIASAELEANVRGDPHKVRTDSSGRFVFDTLGQGDFTISAEAEGFVSARKGGVSAGTEDLEFSLGPEAVFAGKVVAEDGASPIAKARVTLRNAEGGPESFSAETDDQGRFRVRKVPAGTYTVTADHPEFAPITQGPRVIEEAEQVANQTIALPHGLVASGKVIDVETQAPIAEAQVSFQLRGSDQASVARRGKTGSTGAFEVRGIREGTYLLSGSAKGYLSGKPQTVTIAPQDAREFTITLEQGSSISGRVLDTAGNPIAGAQVRPNVSRSAGSGFGSMPPWENWQGSLFNLSAQTDAEGRYRLEGLPPHSDYTVMASHPDYASGSAKSIALGPRESVEGADIQLSRGGIIRGRVLDEKGRGIAGANLRANRERSPSGEEAEAMYLYSNAGGPSTSDREGNYAIARVAAGSYTVRAQIAGRMSASRENVMVAEGRVTEGVDIVLGAGESLTGQVVDAEGNPVSEADIYIYSGDSSRARSNSEGRFQLEGLKPGQAWVNVRKSGFEHQNFQVAVPKSDLLVTLARAAKIAGTVRARGQDTFPSFQLIAISQGERMGQGSFGTQQSSSGGRFEVEVGAGTYVLLAIVPGFAPSRSAPITVEKGERREGVVIDLREGATVEGVAVAAGSGQPVEGASISFQPGEEELRNQWGMPSARSDFEGSFTLEGVSEGIINLVASHPSYAQTVLTGISTRSGETTRVRIELGAGGGIRGIVSRGGVPSAGSRVHAWKHDGLNPFGKDAVVDGEGRFEIKGLSPGEYTLAVMERRGRGSFQNRQSVTVLDGQITEVDLSEKAGIRLSGRILSGGSPLRGGNIQVIRADGGGTGGHAEIDSSGNYSLELPGPGTYFFLVEMGGRGGSKVTVKIPEGRTDFTQDIELPRGEIAGTVVDGEGGAPIAGAHVGAFGSGALSRSFTSLLSSVASMGMTDDQGRFVLSNIPPGVYTVRVFAAGYAEGRAEKVELDEGDGRNVRIALERGIAFRTRVVDGKGQPVAQAMGLLRDQAGELVNFVNPAMSDQEGILEIRGVRPGIYKLTALHRSYAPSTLTVRVAPDLEGPTITLRPGGKVQVQVLNQNTRPVEGAEVELLNEKGENVLDDRIPFGMGPSPLQGSLTRSSGSLVLDQVAPGTYRAAARKGTTRSGEEKVAVSEGQVSAVDLTISE